MTEYLTEQEQIEVLKNWIKQYSLVILAGVVIAIIGITGWRYWQQRQNKILTHASAIYDEMLTARVQNNADTMLTQAQKLRTHYPQTTYSQLAALMLARNALIQHHYAQAEEPLNWVINHSKIAALRQITRIRLARVLIAEQKYETAVKALEKIEDKNFNGLTYEVKGDAYFAMKNIPMARQSYQQALINLPNAEVIRPLLQMKYDNLAVENSSS